MWDFKSGHWKASGSHSHGGKKLLEEWHVPRSILMSALLRTDRGGLGGGREELGRHLRDCCENAGDSQRWQPWRGHESSDSRFMKKSESTGFADIFTVIVRKRKESKITPKWKKSVDTYCNNSPNILVLYKDKVSIFCELFFLLLCGMNALSSVSMYAEIK